MTSSMSVITCVLAVWLPLTTAYSTGPPVGTVDGICDTMAPSHDVTPQTAGYPFEIVTSGTCYKPGTPVPVVVRVNASQMAPHAEPYFEGLFVMARETTGALLVTTDNHGTFEVPTPNNVTTYPCYNKQNSAVGHKKSQHWSCRHFKWIPPTGLTKTITFQGTIARNKPRYWMDVRSVTLKYDANCVTPDPMLMCKEDTDGKDPANTGSDVTRVTATTWLWLVLAALVM